MEKARLKISKNKPKKGLELILFFFFFVCFFFSLFVLNVSLIIKNEEKVWIILYDVFIVREYNSIVNS